MPDDMKKKITTISSFIIAGICLIIFVSFNVGKAKDKTNSEYISDCSYYLAGIDETTFVTDELSKKQGEYYSNLTNSPYKNWENSYQSVIKTYHETINKKFNDYIKKMIAGYNQYKTIPGGDPNGKPPQNPDKSPADKCPSENYSTYCVALNLYSSPEFGYVALKNVLSCRKNDFFADSKQENAYINAMVVKEAENWANQVQLSAKAMEYSAKSAEIDEHLRQAKEALERTLSAYDQLKMAWGVHKKYMEIYKSLIKYRDKLVEIRRAVETFPSKFIDASTTRCT